MNDPPKKCDDVTHVVKQGLEDLSDPSQSLDIVWKNHVWHDVHDAAMLSGRHQVLFNTWVQAWKDTCPPQLTVQRLQDIITLLALPKAPWNNDPAQAKGSLELIATLLTHWSRLVRHHTTPSSWLDAGHPPMALAHVMQAGLSRVLAELPGFPYSPSSIVMLEQWVQSCSDDVIAQQCTFWPRSRLSVLLHGTSPQIQLRMATIVLPKTINQWSNTLNAHLHRLTTPAPPSLNEIELSVTRANIEIILEHMQDLADEAPQLHPLLAQGLSVLTPFSSLHHLLDQFPLGQAWLERHALLKGVEGVRSFPRPPSKM